MTRNLVACLALLGGARLAEAWIFAYPPPESRATILEQTGLRSGEILEIQLPRSWNFHAPQLGQGIYAGLDSAAISAWGDAFYTSFRASLEYRLLPAYGIQGEDGIRLLRRVETTESADSLLAEPPSAQEGSDFVLVIRRLEVEPRAAMGNGVKWLPDARLWWGLYRLDSARWVRTGMESLRAKSMSDTLEPVEAGRILAHGLAERVPGKVRGERADGDRFRSKVAGFEVHGGVYVSSPSSGDTRDFIDLLSDTTGLDWNGGGVGGGGRILYFPSWYGYGVGFDLMTTSVTISSSKYDYPDIDIYKRWRLLGSMAARYPIGSWMLEGGFDAGAVGYDFAEAGNYRGFFLAPRIVVRKRLLGPLLASWEIGWENVHVDVDGSGWDDRNLLLAISLGVHVGIPGSSSGVAPGADSTARSSGKTTTSSPIHRSR